MATNWNIELTLTYGEETENAFLQFPRPRPGNVNPLTNSKFIPATTTVLNCCIFDDEHSLNKGQCLGAHKLHGVKQHSLLTSWYLKGSVGAAKNQRAGEPVLCAGMYCSEMRIHSLYANSIGIHYSGEGREGGWGGCCRVVRLMFFPTFFSWRFCFCCMYVDIDQSAINISFVWNRILFPFENHFNLDSAREGPRHVPV